MTLREAFTHARHGTATGWLLLRWASHDPCTLDTEAQFRTMAVHPATKRPPLPKRLLKADWQAICDSHGLRAVVRRTDELTGRLDDSACLEALLTYGLVSHLTEDLASFAAECAVARRRNISN
jgi:hypothetical protein